MIDIDGGHATLHAFVGEARERLAAVDRKLDALQSRPGNAVLWIAICRDFHAVTRGAAFFDAAALLELCQSVETLFDELRDGGLNLSVELRDAIVAAIRAVLMMIEDIARGRPVAPQPALVARLRGAVANVSAHRE
jgi:two-component system, chemotaxis family, sensor kinase CheA